MKTLTVPVELLRATLRAMADCEVHLCEGEMPPTAACQALDYAISHLSVFMANAGATVEPLNAIDAWREATIKNMGA